MKNYYLFICICVAGVYCLSCNAKSNADSDAADTGTTITPVTVTAISSGPMDEVIELNATSQFLQKWIVRSNVTGYLQKSTVQLNKFVSAGQVIFTVKTKEAESIGNTINVLDSSFRFTGINAIRSNGTGYISEINHQPGDYVQDAEQLAVVTDTKSFVFLLDLPYEMRPYIQGKDVVELLLPDGEELEGHITGSMPVMDSSSQTQRIVLKAAVSHPIPENLIAKVRLIKKANAHADFLPKAAIVSDEAQQNFWVMRLINDSTAVKVVIKKGMENGENVQIDSPVFRPADRVLLTGNFGLPDTAQVKIVKQ